MNKEHENESLIKAITIMETMDNINVHLRHLMHWNSVYLSVAFVFLACGNLYRDIKTLTITFAVLASVSWIISVTYSIRAIIWNRNLRKHLETLNKVNTQIKEGL